VSRSINTNKEIAMRCVEDLSRKEMIVILKKLQAALWMVAEDEGTVLDADKEWDADVLDSIADAMARLRPS
jgi:hypothetical protein